MKTKRKYLVSFGSLLPGETFTNCDDIVFMKLHEKVDAINVVALNDGEEGNLNYFDDNSMVTKVIITMAESIANIVSGKRK